MPSKPSQKSATAKSFPNHDATVINWAKRLWGVISKETAYEQVHDDFFNEFIKLRDVDQGVESTKVTMLNHVAPIYNHIASQGYQAHIHYLPLREAVANYCENKPVADWSPPDEASRSPSPHPTMPIPSNSGPSKKKGKTKAQISDEDRDESEGETKLKPLPPTDGMGVHQTKCTLCRQRGHSCHVNPKATKASAACFECNHWKIKCSFAPSRAKKGEASTELNDKEEAPKKQKKPTQVPAGQAGQFSSGE